MFFSDPLLPSSASLSRIWLAAHYEKKLTKHQTLTTNIPEIATSITEDTAIPLRVSGQLLLGCCKVYKKQVGYLEEDCGSAVWTIKQAFQKQSVNLPEDNHHHSNLLLNEEADEYNITLPTEINIDFTTSNFFKDLQFNSASPRSQASRRSLTPMDIELPRRAVTPLSDTIDHARPIDNNLRYSSPYKSPMMPIEQPRFLDEPFGDEFMPESEMPVFPPEFLESNGVELPFENINGNYIGEESLAVQDRQSSEELSELADEEDLPNRLSASPLKLTKSKSTNVKKKAAIRKRKVQVDERIEMTSRQISQQLENTSNIISNQPLKEVDAYEVPSLRELIAAPSIDDLAEPLLKLFSELPPLDFAHTETTTDTPAIQQTIGNENLSEHYDLPLEDVDIPSNEVPIDQSEQVEGNSSRFAEFPDATAEEMVHDDPFAGEVPLDAPVGLDDMPTSPTARQETISNIFLESSDPADNIDGAFSRNAQAVVTFLRSQLDTTNTAVDFVEVCQGTLKREVCQFFYELLVLSTRKVLKFQTNTDVLTDFKIAPDVNFNLVA